MNTSVVKDNIEILDAIFDMEMQLSSPPIKSKKGPFRKTLDLYTGRFHLFDLLRELNATPVETFEPVVLNPDGYIILISNGKGEGEIHLLDEKRNTVKVIKFKAEIDLTDQALADVWKGIQRSDGSSEETLKMVNLPVDIYGTKAIVLN